MFRVPSKDAKSSSSSSSSSPAASSSSLSSASASSASASASSKEQRRSRRFQRSVDVDISDKHGLRRGRAIDVSRHGLFVAVVDPPHNRHLVQLVIHLPDGPMPAAATVSRTLAGQGVGLSLFALSSEAKRRWDAFIIKTQQELSSGEGDAVVERASLPMTTMLPAPPPPKKPDVPSFVVKLKTVERLKDYLQAHVAVGGTVLFTPVLPPAGSAVSLLVVHPISEAEFALSGRVHKAITDAPKRLEILFDRTDVVAFARFVETGLPPSALDLPPMPTAITAPMDPSLATMPTETMTAAVHKTPSQVARELEFEIEDASMQEDPIEWDLNLSDLPVLMGHLDEAGQPTLVPTTQPPANVQLSVIDGEGVGSDDVTHPGGNRVSSNGLDDLRSEELIIDDTRPAADPGLRPRTLRVHCPADGCASETYTLELGPCGGVLGLVADLVPFFSPETKRIVSVPRLVPAEIRRTRFHHYVERQGQIDDVVALSTFLAAADLAETPRHPITAELLRTSRGIEQLADAVADGRVPLTSKVRCPWCEAASLVVE